MKTYTEIATEIWEEKRHYFEHYEEYTLKIKETAKELLGEVRVLIFGSVATGKWNQSSDIDILIISDNLASNWEERRFIRTNIKSQIGFMSPFQIHLATSQEFENWYKNFIKQDYKEI